MKMLLIIPRFLPELGGAERHANLLAHKLRGCGHHVTVLTRQVKGLPATELLDGIAIKRGIRTIDFDPLYRRAALPSLAGRIHFTGEVQDVRPDLRAAAAFVLPSWAEGFSNALFEAMAMALPCVVTSVGAVTEALDGGAAGSLIPPGDPAALASALAALLDEGSAATRFGAAGRARVEACYTLDEMVKRYELLYEELI